MQVRKILAVAAAAAPAGGIVVGLSDHDYDYYFHQLHGVQWSRRIDDEEWWWL